MLTERVSKLPLNALIFAVLILLHPIMHCQIVVVVPFSLILNIRIISMVLFLSSKMQRVDIERVSYLFVYVIYVRVNIFSVKLGRFITVFLG